MTTSVLVALVGLRLDWPWASWEVENSSFESYVARLDWLQLGYLSVHVDHGVHWESRCWPNEIESPYPALSHLE